MSKPQKWRDRTKVATIAVPRTIKPAVMALAELVDAKDPELLDFLESRFIPIP